MHLPVLKKEVLEYLDPLPNENFIDCTIGEGGHALEILKRNGPQGRVLGIDRDSSQIENCRLRVKNFEDLEKRLILVCDSYKNLKEIVRKNNFRPVKGILLDLGMSSWHLEGSGRGFSFLKDEPLDMEYDNRVLNGLNAERIINTYPEKEIEKILREYGEEKFSKEIAGYISKRRKIKPINTTFQLVEVIKRVLPAKYLYGKIHFATRTFQALRIAVNDELNNLKEVLPQALEVMEKGGRIVVISFHSLEDRIVKTFFKESRLQILNKKIVVPTEEETEANPRSRSAKLRAAVKM